MTRDSSVPHLYVVFLTIIAALFPVVSANNGTIPKDIIHLDQNQTQVDLTLHIPGEKDQAIEVFIAPSALIKNSLRIRTRSLSEVSVIVNNAQGSLFWNLKPHEDGTGLETQERTMFIGPRSEPSFTGNASTVGLVIKNYGNKSAELKLRLRLVDIMLETSVPDFQTISRGSPFVWEFHRRNASQTSVTVETLSSQRDICALISVQALDRRYHDEEYNIRFQNRWQTMRTFASIDVPLEREFENGFYIVALVLKSNSFCESQEAWWSTQSPNAVKEIEIQVYESNQDMGLALYVTLMTFTGFFVATLVLAAVFRLPLEGRLMQILQELSPETGDYVTLASLNEALQIGEPSEDTPLTSADKRPMTLQDLGPQLAEANSPAQAYIRSTLYCWLVFLMGLFYSLPVIQLVLANEKNVLKVGNLDSCFFNFQCKFAFLGIQDFNHVLSNVSYVVFGFLFMTLTKLRKIRYRVLLEHPSKPPNTGVPEHFGIFYALGGALVMEGVLSSIYHICPSQLSLHFDTTFMYVISVLIFLKVHQFRHPDISANAHIVFSGIGLALAVEMVGFYTTNVIFWAVFDLVYLALVFIFTLNVYFYGRSDLLLQTLRKMGRDPRTWKPSRFGVLASALIILVFNLAFAVHLVSNPAPTVSWNILVVLFGNMIIYILYYLGMKLYLLRFKQRRNEQMSTLSLIYAGCGIFFLVLAGIFFQLGTLNSELSPSQSRDLNRPCTLMVFDNHDLWHMSSAFGLFLLFLMILTLEDNNFLTPWQDIQVF